MLLEAATTTDPAGSIGALIGALASSGPVGALLAAVLGLQAFGLVKDTREAKKTDDLAALAERVKACEAWQAARDLREKVETARAEGAREARDTTGRHPRSPK